MNNELNKEEFTIEPYTDIDSIYGSPGKRLSPIIFMGLAVFIPAMIYAQFLIKFVSIKSFSIFMIVWTIRWSLIIMGEESKRVDQFKRQIADVYSAIQDLLEIKVIHEDGLIEYMNGSIKYLLVVEPGFEYDMDIVQDGYYRILQDCYTYSFIPDIHIMNDVGGSTLENRYSSMSTNINSKAAKMYLSIVDYNIELEKELSIGVKIIFAPKADRSSYVELREAVNTMCAKYTSSYFKKVYIATKEEAGYITGRDINMNIDFEEVTMDKYKTEEYEGCSLVGYDEKALRILNSDLENNDNDTNTNRGFMTRYE